VDEIRDPVFTHAVIIENGERKICLGSLDLTLVTAQWADKIRRAACERFGFEKGAVMVCATQTHSSISLGHGLTELESEHIPDELRWLRDGDDKYHEFAVTRALLAIEQALAALQPVTIGAASGIGARVAFNRRPAYSRPERQEDADIVRRQNLETGFSQSPARLVGVGTGRKRFVSTESVH